MNAKTVMAIWTCCILFAWILQSTLPHRWWKSYWRSYFLYFNSIKFFGNLISWKYSFLSICSDFRNILFSTQPALPSLQHSVVQAVTPTDTNSFRRCLTLVILEEPVFQSDLVASQFIVNVWSTWKRFKGKYNLYFCTELFFFITTFYLWGGKHQFHWLKSRDVYPNTCTH